jgi:HPt (histidine-containing phosphotransfer) domain-containing protein
VPAALFKEAGETEMESRQAITETLEGFSAVLLATDPSDKQAVKEVQDNLRQTSQSAQGGDCEQVCQSLDLALEALEAVLDDSAPDATAALDAVTNTMAATAEQMAQEEDDDTQTTWLCEAVGELQDILRVAAGDTTEAETPEVETPASDPPEQAKMSDAERLMAELEADLAADLAAESSCAEGEASSQDESEDLWGLPADSDMELLGDFSTECFDRIAQAEASLLELESNVDDDEHISEIFRAFHTIKGTSGFLELNAVQKLAHLAENLLDRAREGEIKIVGGYADLCLQSCDALREMISDLSNVDPGGTLPKPANPDYSRVMELLAPLGHLSC